MHKHLGHALAQSSLAAVRLYVHIDETQSLFLAFDLYIIRSLRSYHTFITRLSCNHYTAITATGPSSEDEAGQHPWEVPGCLPR